MNVILAITAGIFLSIMITLNGLLSNYLNVFEISFIVHIIGVILLVIYIKLVKKQSIEFGKESFLLYSAGILGVILVSANSLSFKLVGATLTIALSLLGQIVISALVDHFGFFGVKKVKFKVQRLPVFMIIFIGLYLIIK
ncbi:DMT family transporter [Clostridium sp. OS1-26]|uniref:DMT family transporter n=1 Tax=Clostridium sp. OS1-26 TaxID=3070681 RepID=UPI0027DF8C0E|nr:DMT family transporter [Clostridium sp. OS1-26]WML34979.1 DMT family transporter [Clostridium sp. OS1-26]